MFSTIKNSPNFFFFFLRSFGTLIIQGSSTTIIIIRLNCIYGSNLKTNKVGGIVRTLRNFLSENPYERACKIYIYIVVEVVVDFLYSIRLKGWWEILISLGNN